MPYKDKAKQREAQRLWAQKQSPDYKQVVYKRGQDNKKLMVDQPKIDKQHEVAQLAHKGYKWETIQKEVDKCYMLCAPCHRKIHAGLLEIIG